MMLLLRLSTPVRGLRCGAIRYPIWRGKITCDLFSLSLLQGGGCRSPTFSFTDPPLDGGGGSASACSAWASRPRRQAGARHDQSHVRKIRIVVPYNPSARGLLLRRLSDWNALWSPVYESRFGCRVELSVSWSRAGPSVSCLMALMHKRASFPLASPRVP